MTKLIKEKRGQISSEIALNLIKSISFNSNNSHLKPKDKFGVRP